MTDERKKLIEDMIMANMDSLEEEVNDMLRQILQDVVHEYTIDDLVYARDIFYESEVDWE